MADPPDWSWRPGLGWAAIVVVVLGLLVVLSGEAIAAGLVAAASNGLVVLFLVTGIQAASTGRYRAWLVPCAAAAATAVTVLPLRIGAALARVGGPFGDVPDTVLDVGWRTAVVLVVVALTERWGRSREPG